MKTKLIGIIICMLLIGTVLPVTGIINTDKTPLSSTNGNILYVGGAGEGNYTCIQDAINDSVDGGTLFVYDEGSPYYENVVVDVSITLVGEEKDTTIIDGQNIFKLPIIKIEASFVSIQGFSILNSDIGYGIQILSNSNEIQENIIRDNSVAIQLGDYGLEMGSHNNIIKGNIIEDNEMGILLDGESSNNTISHNIIYLNKWHGIFLRTGNCKNNIIKNNTIELSGQIGIWIMGSDGNLVKNNNILYSNQIGILIEGGNNQVFENNIYDNDLDAFMVGDLFGLIRGDNWLRNTVFDSNFWGRPRSLPKLILVAAYFWIPVFTIPLFAFDWHPAKEPYDI